MYLLAARTATEFRWPEFVVGLAALVAAWVGGELFVLRQIRILSKAAKRLAAGDLTSRVGMRSESGEMGELARTFDAMAVSQEQRVKERDQAEKTLLNRSFQQTVVSALGQFALISGDFDALLNQAVMLAAQTLEVEYCHILELEPNGQSLRLKAGVGWKNGWIGRLEACDSATPAGTALAAGDPVVIEHLPTEKQFRDSPLLTEHGVVSGVTVAISGQAQSFGVLGAHTARRRKFTEDEIHFLLAVATVLAMGVARRQAESRMEKLAAFAQLNPNPAMELAPGGEITYFNDAALKLALSIGQSHPRGLLPSNIEDILRSSLEKGQSLLDIETQMEGRTLSWSFHPVAPSNVVHSYVEDITGRLSLEAQLRQSQKMESVGQLAAGVAHDFNNMLTIIQGHAGMLMAKPNLPPELLESAQAVFFASERAASLTRQLLMFSRKNVMQPKLVDLREVVSHMTKMLQRLLGEIVTLQFHAPTEISLVQGDVGMIEQIIMNLAVNARDAMPKGGTLSISTEQVVIDESHLQMCPEARPGEFVCIRVTDTGFGMDAATRDRIFEPFFTTKEVGKGTGLGLATVYGIVRQHDGWIEVISEIGQGSTFSIFFPARSGLVESKPEDTAPAPQVRGGEETILIVEDEPVLRELAQVILHDCGYRILEAKSGREALEVWQQNQDTIDLVLTDMVMPEGVSGMDLAERLLAAKPDLKVIFASGYSMDDVGAAFVSKGRASFLQKPYTHVTLAKAVRDCLDSTPRS